MGKLHHAKHRTSHLFQRSTSCLPLVQRSQWAQWAGSRLMDKWIVAPLWPGPEREREERESTIAGPGPSQPPPHQNYRLDAVKLMTLYTFHIMDFSFIVAPASYHAHSFLAALFVYSLCVPTFSWLCKENGKKLVDTQSQAKARLLDMLSKNNVMSSHAECKKYLLFASDDPMSIESGSWQLIWSPIYFLLSSPSPMFVIVPCQLLGLCSSVAV